VIARHTARGHWLEQAQPLMTPPALPASSPLLMLYLASLVIGMLPSQVTVEGPAEVLAAWPMFG